MDHMLKQESLKRSNGITKGLIILCALLATTTFLLALTIMNKEETFVVIPTHAPDTRIHVSSKGYASTYLKSWGYHVISTLMTTSPDTVDQQIEELETISSSNENLAAFFKEHKNFIKGSDVYCVFFPKGFVAEEQNSLLVRGTFRYWMGGSDKPVTQDKTYRITYKTGPKNVILLGGVEEAGGADA